MRRLVVLIDNVVHEADVHGYVYGKDITGRIARVSFHYAIESHWIKGENFQVITSGRSYVINYNKETFNGKLPLTFEEYLKSKKDGNNFRK
jgi:hypothetical protein